MNFEQALAELKDGKKVAREGWEGNEAHLIFAPAVLLKGGGIGHAARVDMMTTQGYLAPWTCPPADMLADDWTIVADAEPPAAA